jgi:hypothetical protein
MKNDDKCTRRKENRGVYGHIFLAKNSGKPYKNTNFDKEDI